MALQLGLSFGNGPFIVHKVARTPGGENEELLA